MERKKEKTQIIKKDAGIIFLAHISNKDFFEQFQNRDKMRMYESRVGKIVWLLDDHLWMVVE